MTTEDAVEARPSPGAPLPFRPAHPRLPRTVRGDHRGDARQSARSRGRTPTAVTGWPAVVTRCSSSRAARYSPTTTTSHGERRGYKGISIPLTRSGRIPRRHAGDGPSRAPDLPQRAQPVPVPRGGEALGAVHRRGRSARCLDEKIESGRIDFVDDLANIVPAVLTLAMLGIPLKKWAHLQRADARLRVHAAGLPRHRARVEGLTMAMTYRTCSANLDRDRVSIRDQA